MSAAGGPAAPTQGYRNIDGSERLLGLANVPSMGFAGISLTPLPGRASAEKAGAATAGSPFTYEGGRLETPFYLASFDPYMRIRSLVERGSGRELVGEGQFLNGFQSAEDLPLLWDAWDLDADWKRSLVDETRLVSSEVVSAGPLLIAIRSSYRIGERSRLVQDMVFSSFDRRIDFVTEVDWAESHRVLKAAFGTSINARSVRCEIQFGHVTRETHQNLPQDRARFEICAHKWISLEEPGFGLALLNDCKYGHDASGSLMRLSLLRSPKAPDAGADMGLHRFTYALLPFEGSFADSGVVRSAYELNSPPLAVDTGPRLAETRSFFSLDDGRVCIEAVKLAEGSGRTVLRLYETTGAPRRARLSSLARIRGAWSANMLERNEAPLPHDGDGLSLDFGPFEVKTLVLELEAPARG
jgi:alpha-mannosidase